MASDEKRSALDDLYAAVQTLTFLHHVEHHSGEGGSWWKQDCCSGHHEMILKAGEELRALRHEAYMSRCRGDVLAETNESLRELLVDVFDLWDDDVIEHSTPDNYARAQTVFDRILAVLPPEKQAAILGRRTP